MSWNNITPWWVIDLNSILSKCEKCLPEERLIVYAEASKRLEENEYLIPEHIRKYWYERVAYGIPWNVPRKMEY